MKILLFLFISLLVVWSATADACCSRSNSIEYSIYGVLFCIALCTILLPISGLISGRLITGFDAVLLAAASALGMIVSVILLLFSRQSFLTPASLVLLSISILLPTAFYFYRSVKNSTFHSIADN